MFLFRNKCSRFLSVAKVDFFLVLIYMYIWYQFGKNPLVGDDFSIVVLHFMSRKMVPSKFVAISDYPSLSHTLFIH